MDVALGSDHGAHMLRMPDDLHFAKLLTVCRQPNKYGNFHAILHTNILIFKLSPAIWSTTLNAEDRANISVRKDEAATAKSSA